MNHDFTALLIGLGILLYAALSRRLQTSPLSLPIVFTVLGFILSSSTLMSEGEGRQLIHTLAEITLVLILFTDSSRVSFVDFRSNYQIPFRMLAIGMPLTILFGTSVAHFLVSPHEPWALALLVAAILTPTDAALGQSVVSDPNVPPKLAQGINVESGLNDGLALPIVLVATILLGGETVMVDKGQQMPGTGLWLFTVKQVVVGVIGGIVFGWLAGKALQLSRDAQLISPTFQGIYMLASAYLVWFSTETVGGNGFIAAFVGGAFFGNTLHFDRHFVDEFMEGEGQLLTMATFLAFGAILLPTGLAHASLLTVLLALLFLTVVRMLPIWLSLSGLGLNSAERLFLGWFGPRGLASILFAIMVTERFDVAGEEELLACVVLTVAISIVVHGVSAAPLAARIGKWAGKSSSS